MTQFLSSHVAIHVSHVTFKSPHYISCHVMTCHVMSCHVISFHFISWHVMLYFMLFISHRAVFKSFLTLLRLMKFINVPSQHSQFVPIHPTPSSRKKGEICAPNVSCWAVFSRAFVTKLHHRALRLTSVSKILKWDHFIKSVSEVLSTTLFFFDILENKT